MNRERILVVDDEDCIRDIMRCMLEPSGYQCTPASSGSEALAKLNSGREFDLLLCDLMMPGLNGLELLERATQKCPQISALLVTAADRKSGLDAVERKGCNYLLKPFSREQLLEAVRRAMTRSGTDLPSEQFDFVLPDQSKTVFSSPSGVGLSGEAAGDVLAIPSRSVLIKYAAPEDGNRHTIRDHRSEHLGRYQILAELGRGAMGVVYKAIDPKINRVVAIKTVSLAGQSPDEQRGYCERLFREAEAAGRLSHPGIVAIFDVGEEPETRAPYIVMEYVPGQSLDKMLSRHAGRMPVGAALQLTQELAEALDWAHEQGVVHRDLKPGNILVTEEGHAKIADFGVAKLNLAHLTLPGHVLGTPAYMSPEQLNDEPVDGRSDLFSLGAILYTAVTGYRPFQGSSAVTVCFKVVNRDPVPATAFDSDLPPGLDYIIARAMAKDPAQRYQRGLEMALDIKDLQERREPSTKAKQLGSTPGETTDHGVAAKPRLSTAAGRIVGEAGRTLLRYGTPKKPYVSAAFQGIVLLLLAIGVGYAAWHRIGPSKNIAATNAVTAEPSQAKLPTRIVAPPAPTRVAPASLQVEVEHQFPEANLSVWIDDHLAYTRPLHGTVKKHLVLFRGIQGYRSDAVQLAPGKHRIRVRVHCSAKAYDQSKTVAGNFISGHENVLRINFAKHGEMNVAFQ